MPVQSPLVVISDHHGFAVDAGDVPSLPRDAWKLKEGCVTDAEIIAVLESRLAAAVKSRDWTQEWYSVRLERLKDLMKEHGIWDKGAAIIANASLPGDQGNDYWQQLNMMRHRAERAEKKVAELQKLHST